MSFGRRCRSNFKLTCLEQVQLYTRYGPGIPFFGGKGVYIRFCDMTTVAVSLQI